MLFSSLEDTTSRPYTSVSSATPLTGEEKYLIKQLDPRNYDTPRQIRFGARWNF